MALLIAEVKECKRTDRISYICSICGYEGSIRYDHYLEGTGCVACSGHAIKIGFNDLWSTAPDVARHLKNPEDGFKLTRSSAQKAEFKCSECGHEERRRIADVTRRGYRCLVCGSAVSYPNRLMNALLISLGVNYEREKQFEWSYRRRYDFFVPPNIIIEMHGAQHYRGFNGGSFMPLDEIRRIDKEKKERAIKNGITCYIEINASESKISYIKHSILNSELTNIFDLRCVDWNQIDRKARASNYRAVVDKYNEGISVAKIAESECMDIEAVRELLKLANENNDCKYCVRDIYINNLTTARVSNRRRVICITTNRIFDSVNEAACAYGVTPKALSNCLTGRCKTSGKINGQKLQWDYFKEVV